MVKRRRLNKGQQRQVSVNQKKRLKNTDIDWTDSQLNAPEAGRVISRFGQHADIRDDNGNTYRCHIRRVVDSLVCGDSVLWSRATAEQQGMQGVVVAVQERESLLSRPDYYDGLKPVAANIDQIFIISSVLPSFSSPIIDRYLVACEDIGIEPVIVLNKADLLPDIDEDERLHIEQRLKDYASIGYKVLHVSSATQNGLDALQSMLKDRISIVVGQSGVGKSSLVNQLLPNVNAETNLVSDNSGLGQHTTTVATWYDLEQGGALIDSPGIREFSLWHLEPERIARCYIDFRDYLGGCKFRDCKHADDPGCALQEAVSNNQLHDWRLSNYHRIIETMKTQKPSRAIRGK
ncbi:small ribosomal subunit biogenesis GTPase RsgA [Idiomarina sp. HP20-50]|uniref:small ribosomal subunit biogenesis GTPase RsgA n=1 Tax=Idiomarina sp. HP20-50 TaxID=3070813 RepID=UPI00294AAD30|nr:small ribosomal subunit biogenesis GTPase RsgA [Idiomarina sp. HP20-50]MDV6316805.1 small ribosomal subunit biogenesis GTPase RsgA [Idiomarina sp. HP20-50]